MSQADVVAEDETCVVLIPFARLESNLKADVDLSARFFKMLCFVLAQRLIYNPLKKSVAAAGGGAKHDVCVGALQLHSGFCFYFTGSIAPFRRCCRFFRRALPAATWQKRPSHRRSTANGKLRSCITPMYVMNCTHTSHPCVKMFVCPLTMNFQNWKLRGRSRVSHCSARVSTRVGCLMRR